LQDKIDENKKEGVDPTSEDEEGDANLT